MTAKVIMVQGSSSSAGKSLLAAAICRLYARRGYTVAPFKAQNMSNNAAVCPDGSEIGRAQALQAAAAHAVPNADMNPVLIKPEADARSQVVLMGRPWRTLSARDYYLNKSVMWQAVTAALDRLRDQNDLVVIEGAGSAAELNLRQNDVVNMAVARYANSPVLLVGDIDRGGIFAQLIGTLWLLEPEERALVRGLVVNKFRGDPALFADGVHILEEKGGVPVLGVVPYLKDLLLPDEDAVSVENTAAAPQGDARGLDIAVIRLPRIANFDDFDALRAEPGVRLRYVSTVQELGRPRAVILPGTKSTLADLEWLRGSGLADALAAYARSGGALAGICGGYQMLGQSIHDPLHVESGEESAAGLGLLPVDTCFAGQKSTSQAEARMLNGAGWMSSLAGQGLSGYEIHMGETQGSGHWLEITRRNGQAVHVPDGATVEDGRIWGCYLHGIFNNDPFRWAWLASLGWQTGQPVESQAGLLNRGLDALADAVESAFNMELLEKIIWEN